MKTHSDTRQQSRAAAEPEQGKEEAKGSFLSPPVLQLSSSDPPTPPEEKTATTETSGEKDSGEASTAEAMAQSLKASGVSASEGLEALQKQGFGFKEIFSAALNHLSPTLDDLQPMVFKASDAERESVWMDQSLLDKAHTVLGPDEYLVLLPDLKIFRTGKGGKEKGRHIPPSSADAVIRAELGKLMSNAIKEGRQLVGYVSIVGDADWERAGQLEFGPSEWKKVKATTNAFVDGSKRVWIHESRGNPGTMIHEGIHVYSRDTLKGSNRMLNEGVTEMYTRRVCQTLSPSIPLRTYYQGNYECAIELEKVVSAPVVAAAYFDGQVSALIRTFRAAKGDKSWGAFSQAMKAEQWAQAKNVCRAAKAPPGK